MPNPLLSEREYRSRPKATLKYPPSCLHYELLYKILLDPIRVLRISHEDDPSVIAGAMKELINMTFALVSAKLAELAQQRLDAAAS